MKNAAGSSQQVSQAYSENAPVCFPHTYDANLPLKGRRSLRTVQPPPCAHRPPEPRLQPAEIQVDPGESGPADGQPVSVLRGAAMLMSVNPSPSSSSLLFLPLSAETPAGSGRDGCSICSVTSSPLDSASRLGYFISKKRKDGFNCFRFYVKMDE